MNIFVSQRTLVIYDRKILVRGMNEQQSGSLQYPLGRDVSLSPSFSTTTFVKYYEFASTSTVYGPFAVSTASRKICKTRSGQIFDPLPIKRLSPVSKEIQRRKLGSRSQCDLNNSAIKGIFRPTRTHSYSLSLSLFLSLSLKEKKRQRKRNEKSNKFCVCVCVCVCV